MSIEALKYNGLPNSDFVSERDELFNFRGYLVVIGIGDDDAVGVFLRKNHPDDIGFAKFLNAFQRRFNYLPCLTTNREFARMLHMGGAGLFVIEKGIIPFRKAYLSMLPPHEEPL